MKVVTRGVGFDRGSEIVIYLFVSFLVLASCLVLKITILIIKKN